MYNVEIKRSLLYEIEKNYDNKNIKLEKNKRDDKESSLYNLNEVVKKVLPYEDAESKKQALDECKKVMMLRSLFESDDYRDDYYGRKLAIKLAEGYIEENKEDLPLVKEELLMFYLSERKIGKAKQLIIEILQEDRENKWTIYKYANSLKEKGEFDQLLEFIDEIREFIKTDLLIFNLELDILLRKRDLQAIVDLCKNIPNLDLDLDTVREEEVNKLFFSKKRLKEVFGEEFTEDLNKIIKLINRRYKDRGKELNERKIQFIIPFISDIQEIEKSEDDSTENTKIDLPIFNLELEALLRKRDLQAIIDLCENIPNLDLNKVGEEEVKKLLSFKKRLKEVFGEEFTEDLNKIINLINRRVKSRNKELNERIMQFKKSITSETERTEKFAVPIISDTQEKEISDDEKRVSQINLIISDRKQEEQKEELKKITEKIENRIIAFVSKCQIASALGRTGNDIASINLSKFLKDNKDDLSEQERRTLNMLQNFLTSKHAKFYLHDKWIEFQQKNFHRLLNPENEEKRTENKAQNEKNRNE